MSERWSYDPLTYTVFDGSGKVVASQVNDADGPMIALVPEMLCELREAADQFASDACKMHMSVHGRKLHENSKRITDLIARAKAGKS